MGGIDKQLMPLADAPVLVHTLQRLGSCPSVAEIIVVTREQSIPILHQMIADFDLQKIAPSSLEVKRGSSRFKTDSGK